MADHPDDPLRPAPQLSLRQQARAALDQHNLTPSRLAVGSVVAIVVAVAGWWVLKPPAPPIESTLPRETTANGGYSSSDYSTTAAGGSGPAGSGTDPAAGSATTTTAAATALVVDAAGAVTRPGLYRVRLGARVADVIDAAGGLAADADPQRINLAAPVSDGERVYILRIGETDVPSAVGGDLPPAATPPAGSAAASATSAPAPIVDLNSATAEQLDALPGVGPSTAAAIVAYRTAHGRFASVDDLLNVRGIGPAKLAQLKPQARV